MDSTTRILIMMLFVSIIGGYLVIKKNPDYRTDKILESNKNYYSTLAKRYK
ncbi:MAG: hypothetical protein NZ870_02205 [bacterium]|nr:hypothetical protein [bacterium]